MQWWVSLSWKNRYKCWENNTVREYNNPWRAGWVWQLIPTHSHGYPWFGVAAGAARWQLLRFLRYLRYYPFFLQSHSVVPDGSEWGCCNTENLSRPSFAKSAAKKKKTQSPGSPSFHLILSIIPKCGIISSPGSLSVKKDKKRLRSSRDCWDWI